MTRRCRCASSTRCPRSPRPSRRESRKKPDELVPIIEDLIKLLDEVGEGLRHGRHPDRAESRKVGLGAARRRDRPGELSRRAAPRTTAAPADGGGVSRVAAGAEEADRPRAGPLAAVAALVLDDDEVEGRRDDVGGVDLVEPASPSGTSTSPSVSSSCSSKTWTPQPRSATASGTVRVMSASGETSRIGGVLS